MPCTGCRHPKDLGIGSSIVSRAGPAVQVANVERHDAPATVYNFVVEDTHTYFVGAANGGLEVHNGPCPVENVTWPGTMTEDEALHEGANWVGDGYQEMLGRSQQPGSGVFRSSDGLRQFRMAETDLAGSHGSIGPHVHFQTFDQFGVELQNIHIPIVP